MSRKLALVIGNTEYSDPGLAQLTAPGKDAADLALVLQDKKIAAFDDVKIFVNETSSVVMEAIDEFFDEKKPDDMLVLYFSGHGIRDEMGTLYLAFKNTVRSRLRATAIKSDYIRESMDQSRSKRQLLILDCCNSGAFPHGTKAEVGGSMGITTAFQGYGRFVLTASDATQFAWEGEKLIGTMKNSLFTHYLIDGLRGEADSDGDGRITVDELYDYAYYHISHITPNQTPTKSASRQEGEFVLRDNMKLEEIKFVPLPSDLLDEIDDTRPYVREAAVHKLEKILKGANLGMGRSAMEALEKIASDENSTRRIADTATTMLKLYRKKLEEKQEAADQEKPVEKEDTSHRASPPSNTTTTTTSEEVVISQPARQRSYGLWAIAGIIGCCILSIGASGLFSTMINFITPDQTATKRPTATDVATSTPVLSPTPRATLTFTPTPGPVLLPDFNTFQDNFNNNDNDWPIGEQTNDFFDGQLSIENGIYVFESTVTKKNFIAGRTMLSEDVFRDFNVSVKAKLLSGDSSAVCYAIQYRYNDNGYYAFEACDDKNYYIGHYDKNSSEWTDLQDWTATETIRPGEWNTLAITALGDTFSFFINDRKITELVDPAETEGKIYLALHIEDTIPGAVGFDDFAIQRPFFEDFSDNDNAWDEEQTDDEYNVGRSSLKDGIYTIESTETRKSFIWGQGQSSQEILRNFNLSVKAKRLEGDPSQVCYGLKYRSNDQGYYLFAVCDNQKYHIVHYDRNTSDWTDLQPWTETAVIKPGDWNTLAITALDDTFNFYINNEEVAEIVDQAESEGKIWLVLDIFDSVPGTVGYDDFYLLSTK